MGGTESTFLNPLGLFLTLLIGVLLLVLPRRIAPFSVLLIACFMTLGQRIVVAGLNFYLLRVIILFGLLRILIRGELIKLRWNRLDTVLILWVVASVTTYTLLWQTGDAFINRMGLAYNSAGLYLLFRALVLDMDDVLRVWRMSAVVLLPLALGMIIEKSTGQNLFSVFGGVPEFTAIREGRLRCQGPFAHPILAGTFGASMLPLFVGLWKQGPGNQLFASMGIFSSTCIILSTASSGPAGTYLLALVAIAFWPLREHMRKVRWGILLGLLGLHLVMKAPVWFIFSRFSFFAGSTGWHRSFLIDQFLVNFWDWWLLGARSTVHWGGTYEHLWDITNQFILEGVNGGLVTLTLFIAILVTAFSGLGRALRALDDQQRSTRFAIWCLGAAIYAHVINYMSVSYFDQNIVNWYLHLAMVVAVVQVFAGQQQSAVRSATPVRVNLFGVRVPVPYPRNAMLKKEARGTS